MPLADARDRKTRLFLMIQKDLLQLACPISQLNLLPGNPRRGDVDAVKASLERFGQRKPIVVRKSDRVVIAGNHTLQAAQALGWTEIAVVWVDDDDAMSKAFALADNRTAELGDYDEEALAALIGEVGALDPELLEATGWDSKSVSDLLDGMQGDLPVDVDEVPDEVPAISKLGDIWLLGEHRVMCGNSTEKEQLAVLMQGKEADLVWTDPPYGVSYVGGTKDALTIMNDNMDIDALQTFLTEAFTAGYAMTKKGGCWYVASPSISKFFNAVSSPLKELEVWRHTLVWVKNSLVLGQSDYHYRHEFILYGWKDGATHQTPPDRKQDSVWEIDRPKRNAEHPTMKPIELITRAIKNSSNQNEIVLDLFGGSGSTLIAANETNRIAYLMELDPHYVDVICARYQKHTGILPVLESDGLAHDFSPDA
jgi:site-specific DNA-methyltransferase (adenine-specific)